MPGKPGDQNIVQIATGVNLASGEFTMLNGQHILTNPDLTINDIGGQEIGVVPTQVNINASNGVIHVIDTVLLPF